MNSGPTGINYLCSLCPDGKEAAFGDPEAYFGHPIGTPIEARRVGAGFKSFLAKIKGHLITYHQSTLKSIPTDVNPYLKARYHYPPQGMVDQPAAH